ncbi:MAG: hypothetical protein OEO21_12425 [Candidatus Krumholzibacteria bacterium]|nr:hypothetical protein [Candidatus Krumholzibacteria bacterium]
MLKRFLVFIGVAAVAFGALAGCDSDQNQQRSIMFVTSLNCGAPGVLDALEQGDTLWDPAAGPPVPYTVDDFISEDWIEVTFANKPYNPTVLTGSGAPHGDYIVEGYVITWVRSDGGPVPPPREEAMGVSVPSLDETIALVRLVSMQEKITPLITGLQYGGAPGFTMTAVIDFFGREAGTDRQTTFRSQISVEVDDFIVKTSDKPDPGC